MKIVYYVAASIDGYIARLDGDVSWLDDLGVTLEDTGYAEFFADVDGLIMGRKTWEQIAGFGEWPYGDLPTWVVSSKGIDVLSGFEPQPHLPLPESVAAAREMGVTKLWVVGGGELAAGLLNANLLTDIIVTQMAVVLGKGLGLFSGVRDLTRVELVSSSAHPAGFVTTTYRVAADG